MSSEVELLVLVELEFEFVFFDVFVHVLAHGLVLEVLVVKHVVVLLDEHFFPLEPFLHVHDQLFQFHHLFVVLLNCIVKLP